MSMALTLAVLGYLGWAGIVAKLKSKRQEIDRLQQQLTEAAKVIELLTEQDKKNEMSRYVLKSHLRQAHNLNEHLRRQVADQQRQMAKLEKDGLVAHDRLARLKRQTKVCDIKTQEGLIQE